MPFSKFLRFMVWTMDAIMGMVGGGYTSVCPLAVGVKS